MRLVLTLFLAVSAMCAAEVTVGTATAPPGNKANGVIHVSAGVDPATDVPVIVINGGDLDENLRRYAYWADTGKKEMDAASREMVLAFGLDHIIIQRNRPGDPNPSGATTITRQAQNMGKPAIAAEAGHAGTTDA